jgi:hypothetical protein
LALRFAIAKGFMSRLIATLISANVLAHALLGCCSHTVHFAACHDPAAATSDHGKHEAAHSHHHHAHEGAPPCDHAPGEDHDCRHSQCQWLASTVGIDLEFTSPFHGVSVVGDDSSIQLAAIVTQRLTPLTESPPPLPVRSHLALGILLI